MRVQDPEIRTLEATTLIAKHGDPYRVYLSVDGELGTIDFDREVIEKARTGNLNPLLFRLNREFRPKIKLHEEHARQLVDEWARRCDVDRRVPPGRLEQ